MNLSIVVVHYKSPKLLTQCIKSILEKYPELKGNFVIVDNSPNLKISKQIKKTFPKERYIPSKVNVGFAKGVNWGINNTTTEYVMILNPDIVMQDLAIEKMLNYMEKHKDVALIAPKLIYGDGTVQESCYRFHNSILTVAYRRTFLGKMSFAKKELKKFTMADYDHKKTKEVDWVLGACMMVRKKAIEEVGLMDERFFLYLEDVDWCRRFWENGWKVIYFPLAQMSHFYKRESAEKMGFISFFNKMTRIHIKSGVKYFWKHRKKKESPREIYKRAIQQK
ncbi:MAG: glycosyl transferase family 2 [uncultured bacterium]|nr:MAG: glycosyl transferase family 2 [uncultured bacterium]